MHPLTRKLFVLCLIGYVLAHEHHDEISDAEANAAVDNILWIHIFLQAFVWGVMFPVGMVLGLSRSRWHVPLQVSILISILSRYLISHPTGNWLRTDGGRLPLGSLS